MEKIINTTMQNLESIYVYEINNRFYFNFSEILDFCHADIKSGNNNHIYEIFANYVNGISQLAKKNNVKHYTIRMIKGEYEFLLSAAKYVNQDLQFAANCHFWWKDRCNYN